MSTQAEMALATCLSEIKAWADKTPVWLSNREGYARGYREGMFLAHEVVSGIIERHREQFEANGIMEMLNKLQPNE